MSWLVLVLVVVGAATFTAADFTLVAIWVAITGPVVFALLVIDLEEAARRASRRE